jgi:DNA (cytosine-5)-methyltransferase 1
MTNVAIAEPPVSAYEMWLLEQSWAAPYPPSGITFTDFFCGFGGSSIGFTEAGLQLVWAANHWDLAIENHANAFRLADHFLGDISGYDMRRVPSADVAWLSPECTWHSPAGGRKRVRAELDALYPDEYVPSAAGERSRATMWDVIRAAEAKAFKVVVVENVVEVTTWPLFDTWLMAMENLGYSRQIICVSAAHVGDELNPRAPQWRDRIYFVFYKKSIPFPIIEPRPLAWCSQCEAVVESRQSWKRTDRKHRVGKYGPQYLYVCAAGQHASHVVEPFVLPAAAAIDWSDLGTRIGDRPLKEFFSDKARTQSLGWHHLAPATLRRVGIGYRMFGRPVVAATAGNTFDSASGKGGNYYRVADPEQTPLQSRVATGQDALAVPPFVTNMRHGKDDHGRDYLPSEQPLPTAQTKIGDGLVVPPMIVAGYDHKGGDARRVKATDDTPLGTVVANGRGHHQLVVPPFVVEQRGTSTARGSAEPLGAVTAGGNHHGLTIPADAYLTRSFGSRGNDEHLSTSPLEPTHPITAATGANHNLVVPEGAYLTEYYGQSTARSIERPLGTVTTREHHALVVPPARGARRPPLIEIPDAELQDAILNSRFRPLGPLEHGRAQRFPDGYAVKGNKGARTRGFGNAVASNVAHWIGRQVVVALSGQVARSERAA